MQPSSHMSTEVRSPRKDWEVACPHVAPRKPVSLPHKSNEGEVKHHKELITSFASLNPGKIRIELVVQNISDIIMRQCIVLWDSGAQVSLLGTMCHDPLRFCMNSSIKQPLPEGASLNDGLLKGPLASWTW